jgi:hypothetical protein
MHTPSSLYWYAQEKEHNLQLELGKEQLLHPARASTRTSLAQWLRALADGLESEPLGKRVPVGIGRR